MFLLVAALAVAAIPPQARHDADCFEATSWALSWMGNQPHDQAVENVRHVSYYYLGRLTLRDENIDWVMSASRDMNVNPRPSEATYSARLSQCGDEMGKHLLTPATQKPVDKLPPDQTIPPVADERLDLTSQQSVHIEALAEKLCPQAFTHGKRPMQWLAPVAKQKGLTDSEQVLLMAHCVLYSQGRLDELTRERWQRRR